MAITPPSDIVLDVARAADPERYRLATERLARLRATTAAANTTSPPPATEFAGARPATLTDPAATTNPALDVNTPRQPRRRLDAYGQFEAFVLQNFVQTMLPRNATNVFGKGSAGEFWRSMLAEKMGDELARSGQVGIARRLAAGAQHPPQLDSTNTGSPPLAPPPSLVNTLPYTQPRAPDPAQVVDPPAPTVPPSERS